MSSANVVDIYSARTSQTPNSLMVAFRGSVATLYRYVKGKSQINKDNVTRAQSLLSELLEEYKKDKRSKREEIFQLFDAAIAAVPYFAGHDRIYAARRIHRQFKHFRVFQGGIYEEETLPKLFIEELQKQIQEE